MTAVCMIALTSRPPSATADNSWISLFNGRDLAGWDRFVAAPKEGQTPYGWNNDPRQVFTVGTEDGSPSIHVSGELYESITTTSQFTNFHARLEFKWGPRRWPPREHLGRDSGFLYCGQGDVNPATGWLISIESNVMEKGVGQWWSVNGAIIDTEGEWITPANELEVPYKREGTWERNIVYRQGAPRITTGTGNGITPSIDLEKVFGEWNTLEVIFWAGNCIHILNGHVNLVATLPRYPNASGVVIPLLHGKFQLQSEGGEVFYRNIQVRSIDEVPVEYRSLLPSFAFDEDGFMPLLTGDAATKWKQCGPGRFELQDGIATGKGGMGLWWYSGRKFRNFILRGEFRQSGLIADSGVFLRFPDPGNDPWNAVKQGHEMEIGDPHPKNPTWTTGSIYPFKASSGANTKAPGEWNDYEITCLDHNYSVRINGKLINTWTDPTGRCLEGYVGLQIYNDGQTVDHRNVRIKELP